VLTEHDVYLFREGSFFRAYEKLGAHVVGDSNATHFAVWAPNAKAVSVIGDFNGWSPGASPLAAREDSSGVWEAQVNDVGRGALYKFHIVGMDGGFVAEKTDPYAVRTEVPPRTAGVVWDLEYEWRDSEWMAKRARANALDAPMSIY
jgi:1,4-alpha-glucan branching enzyme